MNDTNCQPIESVEDLVSRLTRESIQARREAVQARAELNAALDVLERIAASETIDTYDKIMAGVLVHQHREGQ